MDSQQTPVVALFGASGRTGRAIVDEASRRKMRLRALCRPGGVIPPSPGVDVLIGSLLDRADVERTLAGSTGVACVFGPRAGSTDTFCADAMKVIIATMQALAVRRVVCLTGAMVGAYDANRTLPFRMMRQAVLRRLGTQMADREGQELLVERSGLAWTLVKPPRLTDGPPTGHVAAAANLRIGLLSAISRADLARFILDEILTPVHIGRAVFVSTGTR